MRWQLLKHVMSAQRTGQEDPDTYNMSYSGQYHGAAAAVAATDHCLPAIATRFFKFLTGSWPGHDVQSWSITLVIECN